MEQQTQALTPALAEECEKIRQLLAKADLGDACARYDVGAIVARIKAAPDTYGRKAVDRVEQELQRGRSTLYRYSQVAERWDESAFLALQERKNHCGLPLTWHHFEVLALVTDERESQALMEEVLAKSLNATQTATLIRQRQRMRAGATVPPEVAHARETLRRLAAHANGLITNAERWRGDVTSLVDNAIPVPVDVLTGLEQLRERCARAAEAANGLVAWIDRNTRAQEKHEDQPVDPANSNVRGRAA